MADETQAIDGWLYGVVTGDVDGTDAGGNPYQGLASLIGARLFPEIAPAGTAAPYLTYSVLAAGDVNAIGMGRATAAFNYLLTAWGEDSGFAALQVITSRLDAVLHGRSVLIGSLAFKVARTAGGGRLGQYTGDVLYSRLMATYRVTAQPT